MSFEKECFNPANLSRLTEGLFELSGQLVLLLLSYEGSLRASGMEAAITDLENQLISLAFKRNKKLLNIHGKGVRRVLVIRGAMNSSGRPGRSAKALRGALALP